MNRILCRRTSWASLAFMPALLLAVMPRHAGAAAFKDVTYDLDKDELVMVVVFGGISPDHHFSFAWEKCIDRLDNRHQISVQLLDQQFEEPARQEFTKTIRLSLKDMDCRPSELTVRTIPNNVYTVQIPARAGAQQ
jgi:hypothetical protein